MESITMEDGMRVLLVDCYVDGDGASQFFRPWLGDIEVCRVPGVGIDRSFDVDAVVISGSQASANDDETWVHSTRRWLAEAVNRDVPVLGVCFGHQLLATAVGGRVEQRKRAEVGYFPVSLHEDPLLDALGPEVVPFLSHGDDVLPTGQLHVLGRSQACDVQAFRVPGRKAWGVQFHLEYDLPEQERILRYRAEVHPELGLVAEDELARGVQTDDAARKLFGRFLELAR